MSLVEIFGKMEDPCIEKTAATDSSISWLLLPVHCVRWPCYPTEKKRGRVKQHNVKNLHGRLKGRKAEMKILQPSPPKHTILQP